MRTLAFIFILLLYLAPLTGSSNAAYGDDIRTALQRYGQAEVEIAYPGFSRMSDLAAKFSISTCDGIRAVLSLSPLTAEEFIASGIPYKIIPVAETKAFYTATSADEAMLWHTYPTFRQYDTIMFRIAARWPEICRLDTIGFSVMGRAIVALKISDNVALDEDEPEVMLSASIHGDELGGFVVLMRLAEYLASHSNNGALEQELVSGLEIWINPLANPDGMYRSYDTIIYPVRANSLGYDLNRNFPDPEVTLSPLQQETSDMMAFMGKHHFVVSANLHAGEEVVNYPWDKWTRMHPDDDWFDQVSRRYADTVHLYSEPGYMTFLDNGVTRGSVWYMIRGGRQDYITYGLGGREITVEMDGAKMTPGDNLESLWQWNNRSLMRLLDEALVGIHGTVSDSGSGSPLSAKIFISGHDADSSHVYSDTLTGIFTRFLAPGNYLLSFSADGYISQNIAVNLTSWNDLVNLHVELDPISGEVYPTPPESGLLIWPNPSGGVVKVLHPAGMGGEILVTVTDISGRVNKSFRTISYEGIPVTCDLGALSQGLYVITIRHLPDGPSARGRVIITGSE